MSIQTSIQFLNANDPEFVKAQETPESWAEWSDENGGAPGAVIEWEGGYEETEDEYGGWIIDLADIPPGTTHIYITRG